MWGLRGLVGILGAAVVLGGCATRQSERTTTCMMVGGLLGALGGAAIGNPNHTSDDPEQGVIGGVIGAALGAGVLWGIGAFYSRLRGVEAMGMGDVKMMAMVGAFTGPFGVLITIFAASLIGALVGIVLIPLRGRSLQDTLPFGCFLAPAAMASLVAGQRVAAAYLRVLVPPT